MKPLFRWTVGPHIRDGIDILRLSAHNIIDIYGYKFDYLICCNQLTDNQVYNLENIGVQLYHQKPIFDMFSPKGVAWKLYPPRLRIESHEIIMDNDILIFDFIPQLDNFLRENTMLMSEGIHGNYGNYSRGVSCKRKLNSGIIGLPPGFDFKKELIKLMRESFYSEWRDKFDEQGMVASIFSYFKDGIIVPNEEISNCETRLVPARSGHHFVMANIRINSAWHKWRLRSQKKLRCKLKKIKRQGMI